MRLNIPGLVTLDYAVAQYMADVQEVDERRKQWITNIARRGYIWLQQNIIKDKVPIKLTVDETTMTANYPDDMLFYSEVYVINGSQKHLLTRNDKMPLITDIECGEETNNNTTSPLTPSVLAPYYSYSRLYNVAGGWNSAYYRPNDAMRRFQFQGVIPNNEVYVEYVSTGINVSGVTYIRREAVEALVYYIHWKTVEHAPYQAVPMNDKMYRQQNFEREARLLNKKVHGLSAREIMDLLAQGIKRTPKGGM